MNRRLSITFSSIMALALVSTANAQNFNIDMSDALDAAVGPAPTALYGAAAGQLGFWNNRTTPTGVTPLNDLLGLPTGVTLGLDGGSMGSFTGPNQAATLAGSNAGLLLDDGWDPGTAPDVNGNVGVITIAGLAPGSYSIFVYGIAPDNIAFRTGLSVVGGAPAGPIDVGGNLGPAGSFNDLSPYPASPLAHAVFTKTIAAAENLVINVTLPNIGGTNFATVNGIQIVPEPGSLGLLAVGALAILRRRR